MQTKTARHEKIKELIWMYPIDTQEELASKLNKAGFEVTQATVSRDVKALKLIKVSLKSGRSRYAISDGPLPPNQEKVKRIMEDAVTDISVAQNLVVVKTMPGMAMGAAANLESLGWEELLGCIAGDDTLFCACPTKALARDLALKLEKLAGVISKIY